MKIQNISYFKAFIQDDSINLEKVLQGIDLELIAGFLYQDVRALPYKTRHALMDRFPQPRLFDSGHSAFWGRAELSNEQIANLVFNLFLRGVQRINPQYVSGSGTRLFDRQYDVFGKPMDRTKIRRNTVPIVLNQDGKGVTPTGTRYEKPAWLAECSAFAWSLAQVFIAFGFDYKMVGVEVITQDTPDDLLVIRNKHNLVHNYPHIFGVDLNCGLDSAELYNPKTKKGCERYTAAQPDADVLEYYQNICLLEFDRIRNGATFNGSWQALDTALKKTAAVTARQLSNTVAVSEVGLIEPTNRDVFTNHYCTYIQPEPGNKNKDRAWRITRFDALYRLRLANGLPDLFEKFQAAPRKHWPLSSNPHAPSGCETFQFVSEEDPRRCLFSLPPALDTTYRSFCDMRRHTVPEQWNEGLIDINLIPNYLIPLLTFEYDDGDTKRKNLNFFEFYRARHPDIYIVFDERDYKNKKEPRKGVHWVIGWLEKKVAELVALRTKEIDKVLGPSREQPSRRHSLDGGNSANPPKPKHNPFI